MIKKLRLENYKAWKGKREVQLAPVTLLLGTNSSGKTSLLQPLLLLKQTVESPDRKLPLYLGGQPQDLLSLGSFKELVSGQDSKTQLAFGIEYEIDTSSDEEGPAERLAGQVIQFDVTYCSPGAKNVPVVDELKYHIGNRAFSVKRQAKGGYLLCAPEYEARARPGAPTQLDAKRSYEPERSVAFSADAVAELGMLGLEVQDVALSLTRLLQNLVYLGPLREQPNRDYLWNLQAPNNLGKKGERAIHALLASIGRGGKEARSEMIGAVERWLKLMGLADQLELKRLGNSARYEVLVRTGKTGANLVDVGFGISQVLPVLTLAYFVPKGTTILMEQPEIHLHPLAQAFLADLFVEVARDRKVQFLIETHSEHLFRRLQALIAEEKVAAQECRSYFVAMDEGVATLRDLDIDEFGRIKDWPDRFFGDAVGEMERQMEHMLKRMAKLQGEHHG